MIYLLPDAIYHARKIVTRHGVAIEDGIITNLCSIEDIPADAERHRIPGLLTPGLFDIQVNGGGGVMLNNASGIEGLSKILSAHRKENTSFILPTVITDKQEIIEKAALAVLNHYGKGGCAGLHIEGPHINIAHKGTHNPDHIRPLDQQMFSLLERLRSHGLPILLTLAPEICQPGEIAKLSDMGVIVSAGHSKASYEQIQTALGEGLQCFTHLFNGMPPMTSRDPGLVAAAILSDIWCGLVCDGHHVSAPMAQLAMAARPQPNRMIIVSDAMSTIGGPDHFDLYGERITVRDGRLVNAAGSLAGAHINLMTSLNWAYQNLDLTIEETLAMGTYNPAELMKWQDYGLIGSQFEDCCILQYGAEQISPASDLQGDLPQ